MPDWIVAIILGLIEGITEFIPVSSTGHLLIAEHWLPRQSDLFNVVIQCGAVIAVLPLFPQRLYKFVFELRDKETQDYLLKISAAFAITCIGGFIIDKKGIKLPDQLAPVAWALLIGGLAFIAIEFFLRGKKLSSKVSWAIAGVAISSTTGRVHFAGRTSATAPAAPRLNNLRRLIAGTSLLLPSLIVMTRRSPAPPHDSTDRSATVSVPI